MSFPFLSFPLLVTITISSICLYSENFEVTPSQELAPNGFIELNLMEARDPQGGPDELWITIESMGYSKKLQLCMVCLFGFQLVLCVY